MKNASFPRRVGYAVAGWRAVWRRERSFRTQIAAALIATALSVLAPSPQWLAILVLTMGLVLALECLNAALEYLADALHPDLMPEIGVAKDAAAGGVLIASLTALIVAGAFLYSVFS